MNTKYIEIIDVYSEIIELCDYYNLADKYEVIIDVMFETAIRCTLKKVNWDIIECITLNEANIIKEQFNKIINLLLKGVI